MFERFEFVPYHKLTQEASNPVSRQDDQRMVLTMDMEFVSKEEKISKDWDLSFLQYFEASKIAEKYTDMFYPERTPYLRKHHEIVMALFSSHKKGIPMRYDVDQRRRVAINPLHDISTRDEKQLLDISLTVHGERLFEARNSQPAPVLGARSGQHGETPAKRQRVGPSSKHCFRCGLIGLTKDCAVAFTVAGRPCAAKDSKTGASPNGLITSSGKAFCLVFASSSYCPRGASCYRQHTCSICGSREHGAGSCKHTSTKGDHSIPDSAQVAGAN
jgi:hypothetical protein